MTPEKTMTTHDQQPALPRALYHENHSASQLHEISFDELVSKPSRHSDFSSKKDFVAWGEQESTKHVFYSLAVPKNLGLRASKENEVVTLRGLVADFDAEIGRPMLLQALTKFSSDFRPAFASTTFSGGARLVWIFENPITVHGDTHLKDLLKRLVKEMKPSKHLPGLDEPAFLDAGKYYELGRDWVVLDASARISRSVAESISFKAAEKIETRQLGPLIPIEAVAAEVERQFPGRWSGQFSVGSMGVRFWDSSSSHPKGAWVREAGVLAFTGEQRFLPWSEVLGSDFVRKFEQDRIAGATADIFYNAGAGKNPYWRKDGDVWVASNSEIFRRHLSAKGLRKEQLRGEQMSEVDRALHTIEASRRVDGAAPFVFNKSTLVCSDNKKYLNTSRVRVIEPDPGVKAWGEGFPWIASYLDKMLGDEQRDVLASWLARFYQSGLSGKHTLGQVLVVAGPAGAGKTLLSTVLISKLMGGSQDATQYLTGRSEFNAELFEVPVWTMDDATAVADPKEHRRYTEILKRQAANPRHVFRKMYQDPLTLVRNGRDIVTMNVDDDSIQMLPSIDNSTSEKVIFLLAGDMKGFRFKDAGDHIDQELKAFGAYLKHFETPPHLQGDDRHGVIPYQHPLLRQKAEDNNPTAEFIEILATLRAKVFLGSEEEYREYASSELFNEFSECDTMRVHMKSLGTSRQLGKSLNKAHRKGVSWLTLGKRHRDLGQIYRLRNPKFDAAQDPLPIRGSHRRSEIRPAVTLTPAAESTIAA